MICDVCGSKRNYIKKHKHIFIIRGNELKFTSPRRFCSNCNNLVYDADLDNKASVKALKLYNKLYGSLIDNNI